CRGEPRHRFRASGRVPGIDRGWTRERRIGFSLLMCWVLVASGCALAPKSLRGEGAKRPEISEPPRAEPAQRPAAGEKSKGHTAAPSAAPEIITDLSRLPAPVARTRERLLGAAR